MTAKEKSGRRMMMYGFTLFDLALYLDTHPNDKRALEAYKKYRVMYDAARAEYEKNFGPITIMGTPEDAQEWMWSITPFPWEAEREGN